MAVRSLQQDRARTATRQSKDWVIICKDYHLWHHRRCLEMSVEETRTQSSYRWHCGCETAPQSAPPVQKSKKKPKVRTVQLNIEGWKSKSVTFNKMLEDEEIDIAVIQETELMQDSATPNRRMARSQTGEEDPPGEQRATARRSDNCLQTRA